MGVDDQGQSARAGLCQIIDQAMQVHGATGISQWSPLSHMYAQQRTLRYADGPDEVHHHVIARNEVQSFKDSNSRQDAAKSQNKALGNAGVRG